jgi:hypothetical protein
MSEKKGGKWKKKKKMEKQFARIFYSRKFLMQRFGCEWEKVFEIKQKLNKSHFVPTLENHQKMYMYREKESETFLCKSAIQPQW